MAERPFSQSSWLKAAGLPTLSARPLRLTVSERRLLLVLVDVAVLGGALFAALQTAPGLAWRPALGPLYVRWFATLGAVWLVSGVLFDVYHLPRASHTVQSLRAITAAGVLAVTAYVLTPWLTPPLSSRSLLLVFAALAVAGLAGWRLLYAKVLAQPWSKQRALIVGAGHAGHSLVQAVQQATGAPNPYRGSGYDLVGFVDDDPALQQRQVAGLAVLGDYTALLDLAQAHGVDEIIVAITNRHAIAPATFQALVACAEHGYRVTTMAGLYERVLGRVAVSHIGHNLDEVFPVQEELGGRLFRLAKRLVDVAAGLVGVAVLAVVAPWIVAANRLLAPGPIFYRQVRVGRGGRRFEVLKFRSMVPDAEAATGAVWAAQGDERVTCVGRWLRRTRLDELPQVLNILRGEMSLVGPRPERPEFVEQLAEAIPFYRARHSVRPGLTGWAQVQYHYGRTTEDARIKLEYDLYYVRHMAPLLDLQILFRTVAIALQMQGS